MIAHESRRLGHYAGTKWFQWAVLLVLCGLLAGGLIGALEDAKGRAEQQAVELTIRNMRTGLQLAMGEALMQQRQGEIAGWAGSNPVRWLGRSPTGYGGECNNTGDRRPGAGAWCFDVRQKELIYRPRSDALLIEQDKLDKLERAGAEPCKTLRWRVRRTPLPGAAQADNGFVGLRIEPVRACR